VRLAKARLSAVAKLAGVSAATVSRAINSPEKVRAELRERDAAAVNQLHYGPDGAARALASRRSRTIGAVVPTLHIAIFAAGVVAL
jgi:LacI family transcriptional regulator